MIERDTRASKGKLLQSRMVIIKSNKNGKINNFNIIFDIFSIFGTK